MTTGDIVTVYGRYDVGVIKAIEPPTGMPERVSVEVSEGKEWFQAWEITSSRPAENTNRKAFLLPIDWSPEPERYQE